MSSLKQIKGNIQSTDRTHQVTKAMEAVSAVKMRHSQQTALAGRPYAVAALRILRRLAGSAALRGHPLTQPQDAARMCVVVMTSDKGLAGNLNSAVLKHAEQHIHDAGFSRENTDIVAIGRKAAEHFGHRNYRLISQYDNNRDDVSGEMMRAIVQLVTDAYAAGTYRTCALAYMNFVSTFQQDPIVRTMLPLAPEELTALVAGISTSEDAADTYPPAYTVEPSTESVVETLVAFLVETFCYHALLEAKASEHSARMVAMKSASDKSKERSRELTLEFNKVRQAVITREISEIVGGIEAMATS